MLRFSNKFASYLASFGFFWFLAGRVTGAALLRKVSAHKMLGLYSVINAALCLVIFLKLGWLSVLCVFLCYFFMSITFPTIFALGIFGLGARAKRASSYIVMAIVGGALLPKVMGAIADHYDMSRGFIVPLVCFVLHRPVRLWVAHAQPGGSTAWRGLPAGTDRSRGVANGFHCGRPAAKVSLRVCCNRPDKFDACSSETLS